MNDSNLKEEAPFLFSLEKKNIHRMPDGFFDEMEGEICKQVITKTTLKFERTKSWFELSAAAAILVGVLIAAATFFPFESDMTDNGSAVSVSQYSQPLTTIHYHPF